MGWLREGEKLLMRKIRMTEAWLTSVFIITSSIYVIQPSRETVFQGDQQWKLNKQAVGRFGTTDGGNGQNERLWQSIAPDLIVWSVE
jgi:hypothetical protein